MPVNPALQVKDIFLHTRLFVFCCDRQLHLKIGETSFFIDLYDLSLFNYPIEFVVVAESLYSKMDRKLIFMFVFFVAIVSCIDEQGLLTRLIAVEDGMEQCQKNNEINSVAIEENARKLNETKEIVEILQIFSKVGTSCGQLARLGFNVSDIFYLDYDGLGLGKPPFEAFCQFPEQTLIVGQVVSVDVVHCDTDFCFEHPLNYNIAEEQLEKLLEVSTTCSQSVTLNCFSSPIKVRKFLLF